MYGAERWIDETSIGDPDDEKPAPLYGYPSVRVSERLPFPEFPALPSSDPDDRTQPATYPAGRALRTVLSRCRRLPGAEVPLERAGDMVLAEPVRMDRAFPPFDRAAVDGFAIRLADQGRWTEVVGEVLPGAHPSIPLSDGQAMVVTSGACCAPGTEAVIASRSVVLSRNSILVPPVVEPGHNIVCKGAEQPADAEIVPRGTTVTPPITAAAASVGLASVTVHRRPTLRILTTGDEICSASSDTRQAAIRDANTPMLVHALRGLVQGEVQSCWAPDAVDPIAEALTSGDPVDVVVITGGVSCGIRDVASQAIRDAGAKMLLEGVQQTPGSKMLFAVLDSTLVFAIPGHPAAAHACLHAYVIPALRRMAGLDPRHAQGRGILRLTPIPPALDDRHLPVAIETTADGYLVGVIDDCGGRDLFAGLRADGYLFVPAGATPRPGHEVTFSWLRSPCC